MVASIPAVAQPRQVKASLELRNIRIPPEGITKGALMYLILRTTGFPVQYSPHTIDPGQIVSCTRSMLTLPEAMALLLAPDTTLFWGWVFGSRTIWIRRNPPNKISEKAHDRTPVLITVKGQDGQPLSDANLTVGSTHHSIVTDANGVAIVRNYKDNDTIQYSYAGRKAGKIPITQNRAMEIIMDDPDPLSKAVVTGYYLTGEIAKTSTSDRPVFRTDQDHASVSDLQSAMEGRFAGLLVTQLSGVPGAMYGVSMRGNMSILNGGAPLYVIDGVPFAPGGQSMSNVITGNAAGGLDPLSFYSNNMIESAELLKDADATAIYGSRGANGVILITTKRPIAGKWRLSMGVETGYNSLGRQPGLMDINAYKTMRNEALANDDRKPAPDIAPDLATWDTTRNTNWQKYLLGGLAATTRVHALLSGGKESDQFLFGAGGLTENSVFITHPNHRLLTLTGTWDHTSRNTRLKALTSAIGGWDVNHQFTTDITRLQFLAPNAPDLIGPDGKPVYTFREVNFKNPWAYIGNTYTARSRHYLLDEDIRYQLNTNLQLKFNAGMNEVKTGEFSVSPIWNQKNPENAKGSSFYADTRIRGWILEPQVEYTQRWKDLKFGVLGGGSWQGLRSTAGMQSDSGFTNDAQLRQPWMAASRSDSNMKTDYHYTALFSRVNLNWKDRRILNLSIRRDGSSRFSDGRRYGIFWAAGAGWIFSEESFFKKMTHIVSFGKMRGSYGITGNDLIGGGYRYLDQSASTSTLTYQNIPGYIPVGPVSPDVSWETVRKSEISLDLGFMDNKQLLTVSWYRHRSSNQLLPDSFPMVAPVTRLHNQPVVLQNSGWEFTLSSRNIRSGNFEWNTSLNLSFPVSKLAKLGNVDPARYGGLMQGQSLHAVSGYRYTGLDANGVYQFQNTVKDSVNDEPDVALLGKLDPTCFGGMENNIRLGNWRLSIFLEGKVQTGIDYQSAVYTNNAPGSILSYYSNETKDMLDRWTAAGGPGRYQRLTMKKGTDAYKAIANYTGSSAVLVNASYVRLKTMSLYYNWNGSLCRKIGVHTGAFFLKTENLLTLTPYKGADPENQSVITLPPVKTVVAGMEIKF